MQQIRIFKGIESEVAELQAEVNRWLADTGVKVQQIVAGIAPQTTSAAGSTGLTKSPFAPSDVMIVVLYESAD